MAGKLNSMRLLERHGIPYDVAEYPASLRDAAEIAATLAVAPKLVYKTLVIETVDGKKPCLVMIAADRKLDLKRVAAATGAKKARMAAQADAERLTGLRVGGISALALTHKNWPVYLDRPATGCARIYVSAGQRGLDLRLPTVDLIRVLEARVVAVSEGQVRG